MVNAAVLRQGFLKGLSTTWELAKVMVPTAVVIAFLDASGGLATAADWFAPLMSVVGLPGEAALILFTGYFINLYAAIGGMAALNLSMEAMTILGVMLLICHTMIVELAVSKKAGCPVSYILPLRLGLSLAAGVIMGGIFS